MSRLDHPCPFCGNPGQVFCKCLRMDSACKNGHHWHWCMVHNCVVPVEFDHAAKLTSDCTCTSEQVAARIQSETPEDWDL